MLMRKAIGLFEAWREFPPAAESLARIAAFVGCWSPPETQQVKPSSETELLAFAMFARAALGK